MRGQAVDHLIGRLCQGRPWFDLRRPRNPSDPRLNDRCLDEGVQSDQGARGRHLLRVMTSIVECYDTDAPNSEILEIGPPKLISWERRANRPMPGHSRFFTREFAYWLSSYDTNAMRTADSCRACHSCRNRSKVGRSIRCGRRSKRTAPGRTQSTLRCNRRRIRR
jgi:hypothetical protein